MWKGFQRPQRVEIESDSLTETYGKFSAQPFERGFGTTVGNAMRRCLLSSIEGAAITAVQIEGVLHEFSSLEGVVEDVTDIILNLKQIPIRMHGEEPRFIGLEVEGPAEVTAADFSTDQQVELVEPDRPIATLNEEGQLTLQARVEWARGYVAAEDNVEETPGIGWIPIDSVHSPVRKVNYSVEAARLGRATDYEQLVLEVWTDGTVEPEEAVALSSQLLREHLRIFLTSEEELPQIEGVVAEEEDETEERADLFEVSIDELGISSRSNNTLKNADIHTIGDLVVHSEDEILDVKGFGKKSLEELQDALDKLHLSLGMDFAEPREAASA